MSEVFPLSDVASPTTFMQPLPLVQAGAASLPARTVAASANGAGTSEATVDVPAQDGEGCIDAAFRELPYPNEPADMTAGERKALWCIRAEAGGRLDALCKKYKSLNDTIDNWFAASFVGSAILMICLAISTAYGFDKGNWNPFLLFMGLTSCTATPAVLLCTSGKMQVIYSKWRILSEKPWYRRLHLGIIEGHITMPAPLLAVAVNTESWKPGTELSPADHVAMMRLTAMLESTVSKRLTKSLSLSGETDELCCRVLSAMGHDPVKAVEHVKSIADLKL